MKIRHVLGISGGKDSAALAIYMRQKCPQINIEYYFCDTNKELPETYAFLKKLEVCLGKEIHYLPQKGNKEETSIDLFDYLFDMFGGYLPSPQSRWCTVNMKLRPFEKYIGGDKVVSYVAIRGDEERQAYISKLKNIQSIFPFRKNIWSEDVIQDALANQNIGRLIDIRKSIDTLKETSDFCKVLTKSISEGFKPDRKVSDLLNIDKRLFNRIIFNYLKSTEYTLACEDDYPLIENNDVLTKDDVVRILNEHGVGLPPYYREIKYEIDDKIGFYNRSRSGCYFCFFQKKIEWVWLYEQHPALFEKAISYEKQGFTWNKAESLSELIRPERIRQIKINNIRVREKSKKNKYLVDIFGSGDEEGCPICEI